MSGKSYSTRYDSMSQASSSSNKDYKQISKQLTSEKNALKDKLRKIISDFETRGKEYRTDLHEMQKEIESLQKDKNELYNERDERDKQIAKLLSRMKKYDNIEVTLDEYKSKLETADNIENMLRSTILKLEEQLQHSKDSISLETRVISKKLDEKEAQIAKLRLDKDSEIERLYNERQELVNKLGYDKDQVEKKIKLSERERDEQITRAKLESDRIKFECERKISEVTESTKKLLNEFRSEYEGKIVELNRSHKIEIETLNKESEKKANTIVYENNRKIELLNGSVESKIKEYTNLNLVNQKMIGELQDLNRKLSEHNTNLKESVIKLQDNMQNNNKQYIHNLNTQKELAEKEISQRDVIIDKLTKQIRSISEELSTQIELYSKKARNSEEDYKIVSERYESLKAEFDMAKKTADNMRETNSLFYNKVKQTEYDKELLERKILSLQNDIEQKNETLTVLNTRLANNLNLIEALRKQESEFNREKEEMTIKLRNQTNENEILSKTNSTISSELDKLRSVTTETIKEKIKVLELEKNNQIDRLIEQNRKLQENVSMLTKRAEEYHNNSTKIASERDSIRLDFSKYHDNVTAQLELDKKRIKEMEKEADAMKLHINNLEKKHGELQFEYVTALTTIKNKSQILSDKEKQLNDMENKLRNAPPKILDPTLTVARDKALGDLRAAKLENAKIKDEILTISQKLAIAENLASESEKSRAEMLRMQSELKESFLHNLNLQREQFEKEIAKREQRILELEKK